VFRSHLPTMSTIVPFLVLCLLLPIVLHASKSGEVTPPTTPSSQSGPHILQCGIPSSQSFMLANAGDIVSFDMQPSNDRPCEDIEVNIRAVDTADHLYLLFPDSHLTADQHITIMASSSDRPDRPERQHSIAECWGATEFCAPIIVLRNNITIKWSPALTTGTARMVIVATKPIPYGYYAYNQMYSSVVGYVLFIALQIILIIAFVCCLTWLIRICHRRLVAGRDHRHHHHHHRRHHHHRHHCHPCGGGGGEASSAVTIDAPPVYTLNAAITDEKP